MRLVNFMQIQMMGLITMPEYLTLNEKYKESKKARLVYGTVEELFN